MKTRRERGSKDAWEREHRNCERCGKVFSPADPGQRFCDEACRATYMGAPEPFDTEC